MVFVSRIEGGVQVLSAGVRRTIQSIKDIVGNYSDADIYMALKETNMDPDETTQKLLHQDPFHEVKRRRDRKRENSVQKSSIALEHKKINDLACMPVKYNNYSDRNSRRGGTSRNSAFDALASQEFRVVRDNRVNQTSTIDLKPGLNSTSTSSEPISSDSIKSSSAQQEPAVGQRSSQPAKSTFHSQPRQNKDAASVGIDRNEMVGEKRFPVQSAASRAHVKNNALHPQSINSTNSLVVGVYSSSSDPVHVPSLHTRPAANVETFS